MSDDGLFYGIYKGIVINNNDPEGFDRLTAIVPQVFGNATTVTGWAWPCLPPNMVVSPDSATPTNLVTPKTGAGVWIMFEGGDTEYPVWCGVWASTNVALPKS
jgi:hypothetical protein